METSSPPLLPPEIVMLIKRKSSRDPISRFSNKLHILLSYAGDDTQRQENIGVGWVTNSTFRINKKRLIISMEIKINTLNVNLKSLKFHQIVSDPNGWSVWERPGFTRNSSIDDISDITPVKQSFTENEQKTSPINSIIKVQDIGETRLASLHLGCCTPEQDSNFRKVVSSLWDELIEIDEPEADPTLASNFIRHLAERFRISHQRLDNAISVLTAIFICEDSSAIPHVTILDFAKFLAKFGPEETLMQKIQSVIKSSNSHGNWLCLGPNFQTCYFYGCFDSDDDNCIDLHIGQTIIKIWNLVDIAIPGEYLISSKGGTYTSWENFFLQNPISPQRETESFIWGQSSQY